MSLSTSHGTGKLSLLFVIAAVAMVGAQNTPDRSHPPQLGPAPQLNLPPIQKRMLSNRLPV